MAADRNRWSKDPSLTPFRHELCEQIQRLGGVVTIPEIIDLTILLRPASNTLDATRQQRLASAVARAAVETEASMAQPRFQIRRVAGKIVVSCSQELAAFAEKLGQKADELAAADPLPPPLRVFQELYEVKPPQQPHGCQPFSNERLLKLAAAMSRTAAVSSRQELYPRGMAAERALRLGIGALSGLGLGDGEEGFTIEQIRDRLKSRYPEAEPLPNRPELDALLRKVGSTFAGTPRPRRTTPEAEPILVTSGSSLPKRRTTATSTRKVEVTPDMAEARQFEERLSHAYADGGFLVLTVRPSRMRACEDELLRRFRLERVSFDDLLFDALREEAEGTGNRLDDHRAGRRGRPLQPGLAQPDAPRRTGGTEGHCRPVQPQGASAAGSSGADRPVRPDGDSGDAAGQGGARRAVSRPLGAGGDGRAERHADARSCRDPADHAGTAGQGVRSVDR